VSHIFPVADNSFTLPFHVVHKQSNGGVHGYENEEDAKASAADRNQRAKTFGISAEYVVVPCP